MFRRKIMYLPECFCRKIVHQIDIGFLRNVIPRPRLHRHHFYFNSDIKSRGRTQHKIYLGGGGGEFRKLRLLAVRRHGKRNCNKRQVIFSSIGTSTFVSPSRFVPTLYSTLNFVRWFCGLCSTSPHPTPPARVLSIQLLVWSILRENSLSPVVRGEKKERKLYNFNVYTW